MPRLHLIAGEASGDIHGAGLLRALLERAPDLTISGLGGPRMREIAGTEDWIDEAAVVGLWEVPKRYPFFRRRFALELERIRQEPPDAVIFIDYPGFNLRLARALRASGLGARLVYFISPQAWNRQRIPKMAQFLDLMLCIFPFEAELFEKAGLRSVFVGHPFAGEAAAEDPPREADLLGFFPGSREREIERLFPLMFEAGEIVRRRRPQVRAIACAASPRLAERMEGLASSFPWCTTETGTARAVMKRAEAGVVASGTATLEAAFLGLPYCLVYKVAWPTYLAGRVLIRVPWLGIVNILAGREVVREFLQERANPQSVAAELLRLIEKPQARKELSSELREITSRLGSGGCYDRAAEAVLHELRFRDAPDASSPVQQRFFK